MPSIGAARTSTLMSPARAEASRSFDTLVRDRGGTLAELCRARCAPSRRSGPRPLTCARLPPRHKLAATSAKNRSNPKPAGILAKSHRRRSPNATRTLQA
jgi:hypothetical protein